MLTFCQVDTVIPEVLCVHTNGDGEVSAAGKANADNYLGEETHTVKEVAAILVGSLVGVGREELVDKIAMGSMDFNAVKAGGLCNKCAFDILFDHLLHLCGGHLLGNNANKLAGYGRGSDQGIAVKGAGKSFVAGMVELQEHLGVIGMHSVHHSGEAGYHVHICCAQLAGLSHTGKLVDTTNFRYYEADATLGTLLIKLGDFFRCLAGSGGKTGAHRRHDYAVLQRQLADFAFFKKLFVFHL